MLDNSITNFENNGIAVDPLNPLSQHNAVGGVSNEIHYYDFGNSVQHPLE